MEWREYFPYEEEVEVNMLEANFPQCELLLLVYKCEQINLLGLSRSGPLKGFVLVCCVLTEIVAVKIDGHKGPLVYCVVDLFSGPVWLLFRKTLFM